MIVSSLVLGASAALTPVAFAQVANNGGLPQAQNQIAPALEAGRRILVVELYGTTLYVFSTAHNVGGPLVNVLTQFGFESVLPQGVSVGGSGALSLDMDAVKNTQADHVLFLNFSTDARNVAEVEAQLRQISGGRLYRIDTTTSEALSDQWNVGNLIPKVGTAISRPRT